MPKFKLGQWVEYSPIDNPYRHKGVIDSLVKDEEGKPTGRYMVKENDMQDRMQTVNERFIYRVVEKEKEKPPEKVRYQYKARSKSRDLE
ncbi:hypothetical protein ZTR_03706 [Talaromyces verruculosus]|nr:hypothetical protein ZTR_03706 [Talaromyces verruculosus]